MGMDYKTLIELRTDRAAIIEILNKRVYEAEESYIAEHFPNDLIGCAVSIDNIFYPEFANRRLLIMKVGIHSNLMFNLTLMEIDADNNKIENIGTIYGISVEEIKKL